MNVRGEIELFAERQAALNFLARHGQEGTNCPSNPCTACIGISRYGRNPEYDLCGKRRSIRHFPETFHPPAVIILFHHLPVVSGEAPVLPVYREVIGGAPALSVQVEVVRLCPCFHTVAADADGISPFSTTPLARA